MVHRRDDRCEHVVVGAGVVVQRAADRGRRRRPGRGGGGPMSVVGGHQRLGRRVHGAAGGRLIVGVVIFVGHRGRADRHESHVLLMVLLLLLRMVIRGRGRVRGAHRRLTRHDDALRRFDVRRRRWTIRRRVQRRRGSSVLVGVL